MEVFFNVLYRNHVLSDAVQIKKNPFPIKYDIPYRDKNYNSTIVQICRRNIQYYLIQATENENRTGKCDHWFEITHRNVCEVINTYDKKKRAQV